MAGNRHPLLILEIGKERVSMPTIDITMRKGCSDQAIENCLLQIPQAAEDILENTKKRMLRVSVFEAEPEMNFENGEAVVDKINPSVVFTIGPGRSTEAKQKFATKVTEILSENLGCKKEEVRIYILSSEGNHFAIGRTAESIPEAAGREKGGKVNACTCNDSVSERKRPETWR